MKRLRRMLIARCEALLALSDRAYWLIMFSTLPFIIVGGFTHDQRIIALAFSCQMVNIAMALARLLVALHHRKKAKGLHGQHRATPGGSRDHAGDVAAAVDAYRTIRFTFAVPEFSATATNAADAAGPGVNRSLPVRCGTEPIIGLRAWFVADVVREIADVDASTVMRFVNPSKRVVNWYLESIVATSIWLPGRALNGDMADTGEIACSGVHAFSELVSLLDFAKKLVAAKYPSRYHGFVLGSVSLWGHVYVCERGYRASRAYPHTLVYASEGEDMLRALARTYGCEALPLSTVPKTQPLVTMTYQVYS